MKILFIVDNFPPEVNAPASRTFEHAKRWVAAGHSVTVITCAPNFPSGVVHGGYKNRWRTTEVIDGIRVVRVKTYIARNEGFAKRILDYLSFMVSALFFGLFERRPDVVIGSSPQFFAALGAWILSVAKWRPFVFELRDLWPASIVTVGAMKKGLAIRLLERLELFLYRRASLIVSVTHSFVDDLVSRGIDGTKIKVVRNGVDLERFRPEKASPELANEIGVTDKFVVSYLGTHGLAHDLGNVVGAAELLRDETDIVFLLVGDGADKANVIEAAREKNLENVLFHDSVPKAQMPGIWALIDISLVHLKDDPVFAAVIPSKIFEAMGSGKPIVIVQPRGEAVSMVEEAGAGEWVSPERPEELAAVIKRLHNDATLLRQYGEASGAAAPMHSRDRLAKEMQMMLDELS